MSQWAVVIAILAAVGTIGLPMLLAQASRSGRMARWDQRLGAPLNPRQQRIAWRIQVGTRSFLAAAALWLALLAFAQHRWVIAWFAVGFFAFNLGLLAVLARARP
jgi:hypothetical protein